MTLLVRGYASVFGVEDSDGEIVDAGAFSGWIARNPAAQVSIYWQHAYVYDWLARPVGVTTQIRQDTYGLYYEGLIADTVSGVELQKLLVIEAVRGASFAYRTIDEYMEDEVWHLKELDLREITAARWGANEFAYMEPHPEQAGAEEPDAEEAAA